MSRYVYANVYLRAAFLANVYFAYTCGKHCRRLAVRFAQRYRNQKRAQIPKLNDAQRLRGNVTVNVEPLPGVELSETFPP